MRGVYVLPRPNLSSLNWFRSVYYFRLALNLRRSGTGLLSCDGRDLPEGRKTSVTPDSDSSFPFRDPRGYKVIFRGATHYDGWIRTGAVRRRFTLL